MFERTATVPSPELTNTDHTLAFYVFSIPFDVLHTGIRIVLVSSEFPTKIIQAISTVQEIIFEAEVSHP
jgi:hypothetical protein